MCKHKYDHIAQRGELEKKPVFRFFSLLHLRERGMIIKMVTYLYSTFVGNNNIYPGYSGFSPLQSLYMKVAISISVAAAAATGAD